MWGEVTSGIAVAQMAKVKLHELVKSLPVLDDIASQARLELSQDVGKNRYS